MFTIEGHMVQDFTDKFWGALGVLWTAGGETVARNDYGLEGSLYHLKLVTRS